MCFHFFLFPFQLKVLTRRQIPSPQVIYSFLPLVSISNLVLTRDWISERTSDDAPFRIRCSLPAQTKRDRERIKIEDGIALFDPSLSFLCPIRAILFEPLEGGPESNNGQFDLNLVSSPNPATKSGSTKYIGRNKWNHQRAEARHRGSYSTFLVQDSNLERRVVEKEGSPSRERVSGGRDQNRN